MLRTSIAKAVFIGFAGLSLIACETAPGGYLMPPAPTTEEINQSAKGLDEEFNPMVDIVFVLDNSRSMQGELDALQRNVESFVNSFGKNSLIDYHVGVVFVHDKSRYEKIAGEGPIVSKENRTEMGELLKVDNKPYVDRSNLHKLKDLFNINAEFVEKDEVAVNADGVEEVINPARGPMIEESFSPVKALVNPRSKAASLNKGFLRAGSHLVVIFVTDAETDSRYGQDMGQEDITPTSLANFIESNRKVKGKFNPELFSAYGVLCNDNSAACRLIVQGGTAKEDPAHNIKKFIRLVKERKDRYLQGIEKLVSLQDPILNLKSDRWGDLLGKIGTDIKKTTIERTIKLSAQPEFDPQTESPMIEVIYGSQVIKEHPVTGWSYNANKNTLTVNSGVSVQREDGATIKIRYTRVIPGNDLAKPAEL